MAYSSTATIPQPVSLPVIPIGELLPWAVFGGLLMLLAIYSSAQNRELPLSSMAATFTSSCTTDAICSVFPVTKQNS